MTKITKNAAKCKRCGDIIESKSTHDFVWCSCKSLAVDGGYEYLRRVGHVEDSIDLSELAKEDEHETKAC